MRILSDKKKQDKKGKKRSAAHPAGATRVGSPWARRSSGWTVTPSRQDEEKRVVLLWLIRIKKELRGWGRRGPGAFPGRR